VRNGEGDPYYTGGKINIAGLVVDGIGLTGRGVSSANDCQKKRRCAQSLHDTGHSIVIDFATYMMSCTTIDADIQGSQLKLIKKSLKSRIRPVSCWDKI